MKGNAVQRNALVVFFRLDLHTIGVVGAHFVQGNDVSRHESHQHQGHSDHVKAKEAVEGRVSDHIVTTDQESQIRANQGHCRKEIHNHLCAPIGHLSPRQQVAHEGLGHQTQKDRATKDPHELARLAIRAVDEAAKHVQIHHHKKRRSARGVHVANEPAPRHVAHDVFNRGKGVGGVRLVVHREKDAGDNLQHQHQQGKRAKEVPKIEVLGGVVFGQMLCPQLGRRKAVVHPIHELFASGGIGRNFFKVCHIR